MTRSIALALFGATALAAMPPVRPAPPSRCFIVVLNVDREAIKKELFNDKTNITYDAGGHVRLRCRDQQVFLGADSISARSGEHVWLFGHAVYSDSTYRFAADSMLYNLPREKLEARGNVNVLDKSAGSTLTGPWVDYWRQAKGVNDSARVEALLRPTVKYYVKPSPGETPRQTPYTIVAAHLKGFGQSRLTADSAVTLDRDSLHARSDSITVDRGKPATSVQLLGKPATVRRAGADSFGVTGRDIRFRLEDDKLRELRSYIDASVTRAKTLVTGDTVAMSFVAEKLGLTLAWNRKTGATIRSEGYDVIGDSLAVETPGEVLREIRVFGHGQIQNPRDTTVRTVALLPGAVPKPDTLRNTLWGERILARFDQVDSAATQVTRLRVLDAYGKPPLQARSLFTRMVSGKNGLSPSTNYTRADTILMKMKGGDSSGVAAVQAYGHVYGIQQEALSLPKPKVDTVKPPSATGRP